MTKKMTDSEAAKFYEDPKNREPAGQLFHRRKKDWVEDDSMTSEEVREKFDSLDPVETVGPELSEARKKKNQLLAGLFMLYKKYGKENAKFLFDQGNGLDLDSLLENLETDIVLVMDGLNIAEWAGPEALEDWAKTKWQNLLLQEEKDKWQDVTLVNGPAKGFEFSLQEAPKRLIVGDSVYERIDDPDTGEFLGGYAVIK